MAFIKKTWKDRIVEFAGRRNLKNVLTNEIITVDVTRNEGNILQNGDAFSSANMNDLEQRIADEFQEVRDNFGNMTFGIDENGNYGYIKEGADTVTPFKSGSAALVWSVYGLSGGINIKNIGKVTFTVLNYVTAGNVGVYGTTSSTDLSNNGHLYGYFKTNAGNMDQVIETPDMASYPYIVLHPIYASGWTNNNSINICKITT